MTSIINTTIHSQHCNFLCIVRRTLPRVKLDDNVILASASRYPMQLDVQLCQEHLESIMEAVEVYSARTNWRWMWCMMCWDSMPAGCTFGWSWPRPLYCWSAICISGKHNLPVILFLLHEDLLA